MQGDPEHYFTQTPLIIVKLESMHYAQFTNEVQFKQLLAHF